MQDIITREDGQELVKDENDTFILEKPSVWSMTELKESLIETSDSEHNPANDESANAEDRIVDYNAIKKRVVIYEKDLPPTKETPYFNHYAYFANLENYQAQDESIDCSFGRLLLYSEVITSTNTILEKYVFTGEAKCSSHLT